MKLPFDIKYDITMECWSFYRLGIINSYSCLKPWLKYNYNQLIATSDNDIYYGDEMGIYNQETYYNDVLNTRNYSYQEILPENIIEFIISHLNKNEYILLTINLNFLKEKKDTKIDQVLIYGYNHDKQVFYIPSIVLGQWVEVEVKYEWIIDSYKKAYNGFPYEEMNYQFFKSYFKNNITVLKVLDDFDCNRRIDIENYLLFNLGYSIESKYKYGLVNCYKAINYNIENVLYNKQKPKYELYYIFEKIYRFRKSVFLKFESQFIMNEYDSNILLQLQNCKYMYIKSELQKKHEILYLIKEKITGIIDSEESHIKNILESIN